MTPPTKTKSSSSRAAKPITLADLSDEDRKALLEEAREATTRNPVDVEGYDDLSDREKGIRSLMDARDHARGCPVETGAELGRVEGYDARKPPRPDLGEPERYFGVVRCVECGGTTVLAKRLDEALEDVELNAGADDGAGTSSADNDTEL